MKAVSLTVEGGARGLTGVLRVPGDKSITQRALILGALSEGITGIHGPSSGADARSTAAALTRCGARVAWDRGSASVTGVGPVGFAEPWEILDFGNSGTGLRLTAGALAAHPLFAILDGDESLRRRPMGRIIEPLRLMGAEIRARGGDRFPPLALRGGALHGIEYRSPAASAQVKSCLLLAALGAAGTTRLTEPALSRDHTERMFPAFGAVLRREGTTVEVSGPQRLTATDIRVPGDPSAAAFWTVAALIVPGSDLTIRQVGLNPTRIAFLEILMRMEAEVFWEVTDEWNGEPVGEIRVRHSALKATAIGPADFPGVVDEIPILAVAAARALGTTFISGAGELRVKESDRIHALAAGLGALGCPVEERPDGLVVEGARPLTGSTVESFGDHRIAMSLAVAALAASGTTVIRDTANIATSYPGFERTLARLIASSDKYHGGKPE